MPGKVGRVVRRLAGGQSPEERVLQFFETADPGGAQIVLNLARAKLRARLGQNKGTRKPGRKRSVAAPQQGTLQL
jgi:hypothetical protein